MNPQSGSGNSYFGQQNMFHLPRRVFNFNFGEPGHYCIHVNMNRSSRDASRDAAQCQGFSAAAALAVQNPGQVRRFTAENGRDARSLMMSPPADRSMGITSSAASSFSPGSMPFNVFPSARPPSYPSAGRRGIIDSPYPNPNNSSSSEPSN